MKAVQFHPADDLWGLDTYATEDRIKEWIKANRPGAKKCGVVVIGPAGENQVSFAVIENDYWRSAGRTGVGAVMGSKKIKGIAFWGNRKKELSDPDLAKSFAREYRSTIKGQSGCEGIQEHGDPHDGGHHESSGQLPDSLLEKGDCRASGADQCSGFARANGRSTSCVSEVLYCMWKARHRSKKVGIRDLELKGLSTRPFMLSAACAKSIPSRRSPI